MNDTFHLEAPVPGSWLMVPLRILPYPTLFMANWQMPLWYMQIVAQLPVDC